MKKDREFLSVFAPYITGLLEEKRAMGFVYDSAEDEFYRLDSYFVEKSITEPALTKEIIEDWCVLHPGEKGYGLQKRIGVIRRLSEYMNSLGFQAYYPRISPKVTAALPHIFTSNEIKAVFISIDTYRPQSHEKVFHRMAQEYRVLFRLYYCCGLRNSEGSGLPTDKVDLENGILTIDSKNKTRLVYLGADMTELCRKYYDYLKRELGHSSDYFFPGRYLTAPISQSTVNAVFRKFWKMTKYAADCSNPPTPHDLRFTFITNRINRWALEGYDIDALMPYLSQYVGHTDVQETYYYYHLTDELFDVIRKNDKTSAAVIPEARYE